MVAALASNPSRGRGLLFYEFQDTLGSKLLGIFILAYKYILLIPKIVPNKSFQLKPEFQRGFLCPSWGLKMEVV